jgi:pyruvate-formate lyase
MMRTGDGIKRMDIVDKILNTSYAENAWNKEHQDLKKFNGLANGRPNKLVLLTHIMIMIQKAKNQKHKYTMKQLEEVYIKMRDLTQ